MIEFNIEWEEAQFVRVKSLAQTWARLEIRIGEHNITRFWSSLSNSVRSGVYVSVLPLAKYIVGNWWNLLYERIPTPDVLCGSRRGSKRHRSWFERHNLFINREGMAYPDFSIYREDMSIGLRWVLDPEVVTTPGRFIEEGFGRTSLKDASASLSQVVEAVLERLEGVHDEDTQELRSDWNAIKESTKHEPLLCSRLGELGLDPYNEVADREVENLLEDSQLAAPLLADLLATTKPNRLREDLADLHLFLGTSHHSTNSKQIQSGSKAELEVDLHPLPYRAGYARAKMLRQRLGLSPLSKVNLSEIVANSIGEIVRRTVPLKAGRRIEAVVEKNGSHSLTLEHRSHRPSRFLEARALHHWLFVNSKSADVRLLTKANDWQQASSRAFAAELLAPSAALAARLDGRTEWELTEELASEFEVDQMVIAHQLENHNLG